MRVYTAGTATDLPQARTAIVSAASRQPFAHGCMMAALHAKLPDRWQVQTICLFEGGTANGRWVVHGVAVVPSCAFVHCGVSILHGRSRHLRRLLARHARCLPFARAQMARTPLALAYLHRMKTFVIAYTLVDLNDRLLLGLGLR